MKNILTSITIFFASVSLTSAQYTAGTAGTAGQLAAVTTINDSAIRSLIKSISDITNALIPISITIAVLAFFWFLINFIWKGAEDGEKKKTSLAGMGYSILALFVMVSIWGLVGFLGSVTGVGQGGSVPIPSVPQLR